MGPSQVNPQFLSGAKVCDNNKGQYKRSLSERGLPVGFKDLKVTKMWKRTKKGSKKDQNMNQKMDHIIFVIAVNSLKL